MIGIDVSQWQGVMNWEKAKSAGVEFAFVRACFGKSKDLQFDRNWAETKRLGIPRGAYGWVLLNQDQVGNANYFIDLLGDDTGDLAPACDFEAYQGNPSFTELRRFIEHVEARTGRLPFIDTSGGYWRGLAGYKNQTWAGKYPLWHAQYTAASKPTLMDPWADWTFWQYSATGNKRGAEFGAASGDIDINRFNGDAMDFQKLIGAEVVNPAEPDHPALNDLADRLVKLEQWARGIGYKG